MLIKDLNALQPHQALEEALRMLVTNPSLIKDIRKEVSKGFATQCTNEIEKRLKEIRSL